MVNVWGVGYRLIDGRLAMTDDRARRLGAAVVTLAWRWRLARAGQPHGGGRPGLPRAARPDHRGPPRARARLRRGELSPARLRAIDTELGRAALALEDLDGARHAGAAAGCELAAVDLRELLEDAVEAWRPAAAAAARSCAAVAGPAVRSAGDRLRLAQAAGNLIANAIEHGGGTVVVRAAADARRGVRAVWR